MDIPCMHCGRTVRVEPQQLGSAFGCPHCHREIRLPAAATVKPEHNAAPSRWWENSLSTLASVVFHAGMLLMFALISYGEQGVPQDGEEVSIGMLPEIVLDDESAELTSETQPDAADENADTEMALELEAPVSLAQSSDSAGSVELSPSATAMGGGAFDLGTVGIGGAMAGGGSWEGMLQNLRRNGLDVAIAFDSTSSMSGEISEVKRQVERIGKTLIKLVPKARVSLCTYRDTTDTYLVRGLPLTNDVGELRRFLYGVEAAGGGDAPEAVQAGLRWAMTKNSFRKRARKVVLVFGDAPPHTQDIAECLKLSSDFAQADGVVSTVTCRRAAPMPEFYQIARAGGGEAFLTTDEKQIMTQLVVLVFGARHRAKVLEAFELMK